jgi:hypothetical protein
VERKRKSLDCLEKLEEEESESVLNRTGSGLDPTKKCMRGLMMVLWILDANLVSIFILVLLFMLILEIVDKYCSTNKSCDVVNI